MHIHSHDFSVIISFLVRYHWNKTILKRGSGFICFIISKWHSNNFAINPNTHIKFTMRWAYSVLKTVLLCPYEHEIICFVHKIKFSTVCRVQFLNMCRVAFSFDHALHWMSTKPNPNFTSYNGTEKYALIVVIHDFCVNVEQWRVRHPGNSINVIQKCNKETACCYMLIKHSKRDHNKKI